MSSSYAKKKMKPGFFPPLFSIKNAIAGTSKFRNPGCLSRLAVGERPLGYFPVVFVLSKAVHPDETCLFVE